MDNLPVRAQHVFIVRIWFEDALLPSISWRGSVQFVPAGSKFYFNSLSDLTDFLSLRLATSIRNIKEEPSNPS
jgi:hypothetical protein